MTTIKTGMPIRHGARWNDSEQSRLYDQSQNNLSLEAIADLHQRSVVSILLKQKALGLRDENDELLKPIPSSDGLSMNYIQPVNREDNLPSKVSKQGGVNHSLLSVKPIGGADKAIKASIQKSTSPDASLSVQKNSGQQVEACHSEMLSLCCSVANFTLTSNP